MASAPSRTFIGRSAALDAMKNLRKDRFGATPKPARETRALPRMARISQQGFCRIDHVLRVDAALLHHFGTRCAQAEFVQPDHFPVETDVLIPNLGHASFDRDASAACVRQNLFA